MKGEESPGAMLDTVEEEEGADPDQRLVFSLCFYNLGTSLTLVEEPPES